jgi:UDP-N-acetylmuramate--alanine ligase
MDIEKIHSVYFIGIGGIGMSALARYFNFLKLNVSGYDRTETALTKELVREGINIHYVDQIDLIPKNVLESNPGEVLLIYTPAIPKSHKQYNYLIDKGFNIYKRSEILGLISKYKKGIAVAGTHGKTTVSSQIAHVFKQSEIDCNAFLGGITNNYKTNFLFSNSSKYMVLEADEYDRSFLQLHPHIAVITSMESDHLDIYGEFKNLKSNFEDFVNQVDNDGVLIINKDVDIELPNKADQEVYYYSIIEETDFYAKNIRLENYKYTIDLVTPSTVISNLEIGFPGYINIENAIASAAVAYLTGMDIEQIQNGIKTYSGVQRRFDHKIISDKIVFIDDYAHHPTELSACISSVKKLYSNKKVTGIFQPHLYSRTRDFAAEFARSLEELDNIILIDLYPAREEPIEGVSSKIIFDKIENPNKKLCGKSQIVELLEKDSSDIILTLGAGDIDKEVEAIKNFLKKKYKV